MASERHPAAIALEADAWRHLECELKSFLERCDFEFRQVAPGLICPETVVSKIHGLGMIKPFHRPAQGVGDRTTHPLRYG